MFSYSKTLQSIMHCILNRTAYFRQIAVIKSAVTIQCKHEDTIRINNHSWETNRSQKLSIVLKRTCTFSIICTIQEKYTATHCQMKEWVAHIETDHNEHHDELKWME